MKVTGRKYSLGVVTLTFILGFYVMIHSNFLAINVVSVGSVTGRMLIDPEWALEHGYNGYVEASYLSETPPRMIISPGKTLNFTIRLKLISHIPSYTEAEVLLDPENSSKCGVGWGEPVPIFNDYIRYSPNGTIILNASEPSYVTMILSVPEGMTGMSAYPQDILGVGIMADIPVASEGSVSLDRIHK